ncbi:hypothetical protein ACIOG4_27750 [Streptomyces microflavus]|uniref:hypothetical protein n=1 Tax=Streptomyces microflavus TaxID=1919 RepID=UPI003802344C
MSYAASSADRAATIAAIARSRAASHPDADTRSTLTKIAALLDDAATGFRTSTPAVINGVIMNEIPGEAWIALTEAESIAADSPASGFPATLGQYVTRRTGFDLPPPLSPSGKVVIAEEMRLVVHLRRIHTRLVAAEPDTAVADLLEEAFRLHDKHADLARSLAAAAARPDLQSGAPTVVEIRTPATTAQLRRAHDLHGDTLAYALVHQRPPCHSAEHAVPAAANQMVSHLGATVPSCEAHRGAAADAARELYNALH